ncbi:winged helix DNA-binding domain-containing protein, partial [Polyplosphaeria fusca]
MYHPPSAYLIEPQNSQDAAEPQDHAMSSQLLQMQFNDDYDLHCGANASPDDSGGYSSLIRSNTATRCSTPQDNGFGHARSDVSGEDGVIEKDQPYAQLIYRALMEAPSHTMILRDIYSWFKENTDKANDKETKGWQNSIRHNLSMNGAFEKVDQPGEEPRKGFMWKLTNEAIQEGVKSTTRYRSKQPNKRGHRMGQPQPQRQASGAKGGQAAKR